MTFAPVRPAFRLNGWHVLAGFVAFFGVTLAVDTYMLVSAYRTYPGEVADTPYEAGLAYDRVLNQEKAQAALGWRMSLGLVGSDVVRLTAIDRVGQALPPLRIEARLERPATEDGRRAIQFLQIAPGVYEAHVGPLAGAWDVKLSAYDAQRRRFDAERRLVAQ